MRLGNSKFNQTLVEVRPHWEIHQTEPTKESAVNSQNFALPNLRKCDKRRINAILLQFTPSQILSNGGGWGQLRMVRFRGWDVLMLPYGSMCLFRIDSYSYLLLV